MGRTAQGRSRSGGGDRGRLLLYKGQGSNLWLPFVKGVVEVPVYAYVPGAAMLLWFTMNATNCSDGVDGLAGSLTLLSLFSLAGLLYGVIGYRPIADYLLIPPQPGRRALGDSAGHPGGGAGRPTWWHNAEPSRVLMGDAGRALWACWWAWRSWWPETLPHLWFRRWCWSTAAPA